MRRAELAEAKAEAAAQESLLASLQFDTEEPEEDEEEEEEQEEELMEEEEEDEVDQPPCLAELPPDEAQEMFNELYHKVMVMSQTKLN